MIPSTKRQRCPNASAGDLFACLAVAYAVLYGVTGMVKLVSAFVPARIGQEADLVLGLSNRWLFFGAGVMEVVVAIGILSRRVDAQISWMLVGWLSVNFLAYRMLNWMGGSNPCPCLGSLFSYSKWLQAHGPTIFGIIAASGILGAGLFFVRLWHQRHAADAGQSLCP